VGGVGVGAARPARRHRRDAAGWCREVGATIVHGHWVVPAAPMAALAAAGRPLVVSLHGSDVFVAERHAVAGTVARRTFAAARWVTACSADLRDRAIGLGADAARSSVIPYGVDAEGFPATTRRGPAAGRCSASATTCRWWSRSAAS
jgi:hypothetical protein